MATTQPTEPEAFAPDSPSGVLAHTLQSRHVTMISFGGIIGAGVFIGSSGAIHTGGPGVALTYGACGILVFLIMRMLGEMAVANPGRGSFAEYAALALGPWAGFVTRWLYWYFWVFTVGAETVAGAKLLHELGLPGELWMIGLGLVLGLTATNLLSVRAYGELEFWFALLKVTAIALFILIGLGFLSIFGGGPTKAATTLLGHGGFLPKGAFGLLAAVPIVIFSMMGSEVATIAASESADPAANVAKAGRTVALRIMVFYVLAMLVITSVVPWDSLTVGLSPFKRVLDQIGIPYSGLVMSVIVVTAVLSCLNSGLYITSRMLFELSKNGDAPRFLSTTAANKTPAFGIAVGCVAGFGAALAQLFLRDDVFTLLSSTSGDIILFVYMIIALAQIRARNRMQAQGRTPSLKVWLFPWLSYAVIAAIAGVLILLALMPDQRLTLALSAATVAATFAALMLRRKVERVN